MVCESARSQSSRIPWACPPCFVWRLLQLCLGEAANLVVAPSRRDNDGADVTWTRQLRGIDGGETELGRTFGGVHCGSSRLKGQRPCHGNATELVSKGAWAWGCPGIASLFELRVSGSGLNMQGLGSTSKSIASRSRFRVTSGCAERVVGIFSLPPPRHPG